jgi:hypothetical protein
LPEAGTLMLGMAAQSSENLNRQAAEVFLEID